MHRARLPLVVGYVASATMSLRNLRAASCALEGAATHRDGRHKRPEFEGG